MRRLFLTSLIALTAAVAGANEPRQSVRFDSVAAAKQAVVEHLTAYSSTDNPHWLLGQNAGHGNADLRADYQQNVTRLQEATGHLPALLGVDLGFDAIPRRSTAVHQLSREFWNRGGLVAVSMHPPSPFRNSTVHDTRPVDWDEIFRPDSAVHRRWLQTLDRVADLFAELRNDGVVVLWRPLHEMNGGWFWWCARYSDGTWTGRREFRALWQQMYRYFERRGLDNLLWVYAPAVQTSSEQRSVTHYYPGAEFVDVVGLDWYDDHLQDLDSHGSYRQLAALGKPMGLTEVGPLAHRTGDFDNLAVVRAMRNHPRLGFALFWHSWPGASVAAVDNTNVAELVAHPHVVTFKQFRDEQSKRRAGR